jgi:hypothetical protein
MLNIFADAMTVATGQNSNISPLGEDERWRLYLEQTRRERRLALRKELNRIYRQA